MLLVLRKNKFLLLMTPVIVASFAQFASAREESMTVVHYSKEELEAAAHPNFIHSQDLSDVLKSKFLLLASTLTQRQAGGNNALVDFANKTAQPTHEQNMKKLGTIVYNPDTKIAAVDGDGIRTNLAGQTRKAVEAKSKDAVPFLEQFRKGASFKFSLLNSGKSKEPSPSETPVIRYGLVVADIEPTKAPALASLGSTNDLGMEYATPARVTYTIDRVDEQSGRKIFHKNTTPEADVAPLASGPTSTRAWTHPSTDVDVNVAPSNMDDTVSDKVSGGALPGAKVTLSQADGFLATQVVTNSRLGKESVTHEVKLPVAGEAYIARKVDEHLKPVQTSANNLLVRESAPKLNIHYLHNDDKFKGELLVKRTSYDMGIVAEPRQGWAPGRKVGQEGDKVSLTYNRSF